MAKNTNKIRILFCGNNANDVTGSQVYVETPHRKLLIECGMTQTVGDKKKDWRENSKKFEFKPKDLDYIFIMHQHIDHGGLLPLVFARGANCPIIAPSRSTMFSEILWRDCAHIIQSDSEELTKKTGKQILPFYTPSDVDNALSHINEYPDGEIFVLDEFVKFRFVPSGHVVNGCQLELWITEGNITKKLLYTSDLGNEHIEKAYVKKLARVEKADVVISESTYAGQEKIADAKMRKLDLEKLECSIRQTCVDLKSRVLIPVFAFDRLQNIMTVLYQIFSSDKDFNIPVLIDTPMGTNMCNAYSETLEGEDLELWRDVYHWKNFRFISDYMESRAWRDSKIPCVVLSSSGFLIAGRSVAWTASLLPRATDRVITVGYAPPGSIGYIIKNETQKTISITGKRYSNKCQITNLGSFTSHIQRDSLMNYLSSIDCSKIYLVHGEMNGKIGFSKELQEQISRNNKTSRVVCVNKGMEISL